MEMTSSILSFFIFSFVGWCYESFLCSLYKYGHFINRGFLLGPCCPIYGAGAMLCWLLFRSVDSLPLLFLASALCCSAVEYFTGWALERAFHAKWWDYSTVPLNLHGRVCFRGAVLFGLMCVLICREIEPALFTLLNRLPLGLVAGICVICCALLAADLTTAIISWQKLNAHLEAIRAEAFDRSNQNLGLLSETLIEKSPVQIEAITSGLHVWADNWTLFIRKAELRFLNAVPDMRIPRYEKLLNMLKLKEYVARLFEDCHDVTGFEREPSASGSTECYTVEVKQNV